MRKSRMAIKFGPLKAIGDGNLAVVALTAVVIVALIVGALRA